MYIFQALGKLQYNRGFCVCLGSGSGSEYTLMMETFWLITDWHKGSEITLKKNDLTKRHPKLVTFYTLCTAL